MKSYIRAKTYTQMFIAALLIISKHWKQPDGLEQLHDKQNMLHLCSGILFSHTKEWNTCISVSQPQHYWHLGQIMLCCEGCSVHCRMFISMPGLYVLDSSNNFLLLTHNCGNQKCFQTLPNVLCGAKSPLFGSHWYKLCPSSLAQVCNLSLIRLSFADTARKNQSINQRFYNPVD